MGRRPAAPRAARGRGGGLGRIADRVRGRGRAGGRLRRRVRVRGRCVEPGRPAGEPARAPCGHLRRGGRHVRRRWARRRPRRQPGHRRPGTGHDGGDDRRAADAARRCGCVLVADPRGVPCRRGVTRRYEPTGRVHRRGRRRRGAAGSGTAAARAGCRGRRWRGLRRARRRSARPVCQPDGRVIRAAT